MEGLKVRWDKGGEVRGGEGEISLHVMIIKSVKCKTNDIWNISGYITEEANVYGNVKTKWCISGKVKESLKMDLVKEFWPNVKLSSLTPSNFALSHIRLKDESAKVRGATTEHHRLIKVYEEKIVSCKQWILYSRPLLTSLRFAMLHKLWQISSNRWELAIERKGEERSKQKHKYNTVRWTWLGKG